MFKRLTRLLFVLLMIEETCRVLAVARVRPWLGAELMSRDGLQRT
jgi:hypothetical protein